MWSGEREREEKEEEHLFIHELNMKGDRVTISAEFTYGILYFHFFIFSFDHLPFNDTTMTSHLYAVVPPLAGWCLRVLVLSDLAEVRLPPRPHEYLLQVFY